LIAILPPAAASFNKGYVRSPLGTPTLHTGDPHMTLQSLTRPDVMRFDSFRWPSVQTIEDGVGRRRPPVSRVSGLIAAESGHRREKDSGAITRPDTATGNGGAVPFLIASLLR